MLAFVLNSVEIACKYSLYFVCVCVCVCVCVMDVTVLVDRDTTHCLQDDPALGVC